eukprot:1195484-Prorocentrum_minimum.AAC.1
MGSALSKTYVYLPMLGCRVHPCRYWHRRTRAGQLPEGAFGQAAPAGGGAGAGRAARDERGAAAQSDGAGGAPPERPPHQPTHVAFQRHVSPLCGPCCCAAEPHKEPARSLGSLSEPLGAYSCRPAEAVRRAHLDGGAHDGKGRIVGGSFRSGGAE